MTRRLVTMLAVGSLALAAPAGAQEEDDQDGCPAGQDPALSQEVDLSPLAKAEIRLLCTDEQE